MNGERGVYVVGNAGEVAADFLGRVLRGLTRSGSTQTYVLSGVLVHLHEKRGAPHVDQAEDVVGDHGADQTHLRSDAPFRGGRCSWRKAYTEYQLQ